MMAAVAPGECGDGLPPGFQRLITTLPSGADLDLAFVLHRFRALRQLDRKHANAGRCLDLRLADAARQFHRALEMPVAAG